jgi:uncharacterized ferritin-like protein (DUF455 family)
MISSLVAIAALHRFQIQPVGARAANVASNHIGLDAANLGHDGRWRFNPFGAKRKSGSGKCLCV